MENKVKVTLDSSNSNATHSFSVEPKRDKLIISTTDGIVIGYIVVQTAQEDVRMDGRVVTKPLGGYFLSLIDPNKTDIPGTIYVGCDDAIVMAD